MTSQKQKQGLTQEAFDTLLNHLGPDAEQAALQYEKVRQKVIKALEWRNCYQPEEIADETLNRVAKKLVEGAVVEQLASYCVGIARHVLQEWRRNREREAAALAHLPTTQPLDDNEDEDNVQAECLHICLNDLPEESRSLLKEYYDWEKGSKIEKRRRMAEQMGISLNNLRIRALRARDTLERCIRNCMKVPEPMKS